MLGYLQNLPGHPGTLSNVKTLAITPDLERMIAEGRRMYLITDRPTLWQATLTLDNGASFTVHYWPAKHQRLVPGLHWNRGPW